jgi:hypothetical protein
MKSLLLSILLLTGFAVAAQTTQVHTLQYICSTVYATDTDASVNINWTTNLASPAIVITNFPTTATNLIVGTTNGATGSSNIYQINVSLALGSSDFFWAQGISQFWGLSPTSNIVTTPLGPPAVTTGPLH